VQVEVVENINAFDDSWNLRTQQVGQRGQEAVNFSLLCLQ